MKFPIPLLFAATLQAETYQFYNDRGTQAFKNGQIEKSIEDFDKAIELEPRLKAHHWQRGISLYYAGRFDDCRKQFEIHKTVNPQDVENAVWHYLCVARTKGVDAARKGLIPIQRDDRVPMMEVYAMYRGMSDPEKVLAAARSGGPPEGELHVRLFYAHLYIGLFHEAAGEKKLAIDHIRKAAADYEVGHYMWDVARIHAKLAR
jgi:lipoprotein NlpI